MIQLTNNSHNRISKLNKFTSIEIFNLLNIKKIKRLKSLFLFICLFFCLSLVSLNLSAFDHNYTTWDVLLKKHVKQSHGTSQVNYTAWIKDLNTLEAFTLELSKVTKSEYNSWTSKQKQAFLINAYNALTVQLILKNDSLEKGQLPKSIKDLGNFIFTPWKKKFFNLLGQKMSLDHLEHNIARAQFKNCYLHFAFVCASISCPMLRAEAWTAPKLNQQYQNSADIFINNPSHNQLKDGELYISSIFKWYKKDFETSPVCEGSIGAFINKHLKSVNSSDQKKLINNLVPINYKKYNWLLNGK